MCEKIGETGRESKQSSTKKNEHRTVKKTKTIENKKKKHLKQQNQCAYLGEKTWKRAGEQFYITKSAQNSLKQQKRPKKPKIKSKKT